MNPRALLGARGLRPKKSLGQNFLMDAGTSARIARLTVDAPGDRVLEVGAGTGSLTAALLAAGADLTAFDLDDSLVDILRSRADLTSARIEHGDALEFDYAEYGGESPWRVAGNLPYNIATPLLIKLAQMERPPERIVAMIQKDVADRLLAKPGTAAYGSLTVALSDARRARVQRFARPVFSTPESRLVGRRLASPRCAADRRARSATLRTGRARRVRVPPQDARQLAFRSRSNCRASRSRRRCSPSNWTPTSVEKPSISEPSPLSPTRWPADAFTCSVRWPSSWRWRSHSTSDCGSTPRSPCTWGSTRQDFSAATLTWGIAIGQYFSYVPLLVVLLIAMPWLSRRSLGELGLRGFSRTTVVAGVLGALAMYAVTIGVANVQFLFTHQKPEETAISLFTSTHDTALIVTFTFLAAVVAPFMEEFVFRGFLFNALLRYLPVWSAAALSGIIFGASHGSPSAFLPLAASGVVLAYVYERSGSLTASMLTHALFNLINVALISLAKT